MSYEDREEGDALDIERLLDNDEVDDGLGDLEIEQEEIGAEELTSRVRRLVELREEKDETKKAADRAKREFDAYQLEFFELLEHSPIKGSLKLDLGGEFGTVQIVPRKTLYGRILDKDKALDYFNQRALTEEYTESVISKSRLNELVRTLEEEGKPMPDGVDYYTKRFFTVSFKD